MDHVCVGYASRTHQDVTRQLSYGNDVEFVFPVHHQNGQIRWLLGRGECFRQTAEDADCLRGVLVDITSSKQQYDKRRHTAEQYRIILEQAGEVMFEWDLLDDKAQFSEGWEEKFGYTVIYCNTKDSEKLK